MRYICGIIMTLILCMCCSCAQTETDNVNKQFLVSGTGIYADDENIYYGMYNKDEIFGMRCVNKASGEITDIAEAHEEATPFAVYEDNFYYNRINRIIRKNMKDNTEEEFVNLGFGDGNPGACRYIEFYNGHAYCQSGTRILRIKNGEKTILKEDVEAMCIAGDKIFYSSLDGELHECDLSGKKDRKIISAQDIFTSGKYTEKIHSDLEYVYYYINNMIIHNDRVYFILNGRYKFGEMYSCDFNGENLEYYKGKSFEDNLFAVNMQLADEKIYYTGLKLVEENERHVEWLYQIMCYNPENGEKKCIKEEMTGIAIIDETIYFFDAGEGMHMLKSMDLNGENEKIIDSVKSFR